MRYLLLPISVFLAISSYAAASTCSEAELAFYAQLGRSVAHTAVTKSLLLQPILRVEIMIGRKAYSVPAEMAGPLQNICTARPQFCEENKIAEIVEMSTGGGPLQVVKSQRNATSGKSPTAKDLTAIGLRSQEAAWLVNGILNIGKNDGRSQLAAMAMLLGAKIDSIAIVTHQTKSLQEATANLLSQDLVLKNIPTITLISPEFQIKSAALLGRSDKLLFSGFGELNNIRASIGEIHLFGGFCSLCLSSTFTDLLKNFLLSSTQAKAEFFLHSTNIYTSGLFENLAEDIYHAQGKHLPFSKILNIGRDTEELIGPQGIKAGMSVEPYVQTRYGPAQKYQVLIPELGKEADVYILAE